jgi:outer membrane protein OmpA-like peptidoglycan-associated protein
MKILFPCLIMIILLSPGVSLADSIPLSVGIILNGGSSREVWFSPNFDGCQDTVTIGLDIKSAGLLQGWSVSIINQSNQAVWTRSGVRSRDVPADPGQFWNRLWSKKENAVIPEALIWDGRADSGSFLPEGKYFIIASAWDDMKNTVFSETDSIILDVTPPKGSLAIYDNIFYPNSGGKKGLFFISQTLSTNGFWRAEIRNREGAVVKSWDWGDNNNTPPAMLEWDGKGSDGTLQPEGTYDYIAYGWDRAGNKTVMPLPGINLSRQVYSVFLAPDRPGFSPAAVKPYNEIKLYTAVSVTNGLFSWDLKIRDKNFKITKELQGRDLPQSLAWDGTGDDMKTAADGLYKCTLECTYSPGDSAFSGENSFIIDSSHPELSLTAGPNPFSPDDKGTGPLTIHFSAEGANGIKYWKIEILDPDSKLFKSFEGHSEPASVIAWDGRSDNGELVESALNYRLIAEALDGFGNRAEKELDGGINVDVLVEKTRRGYMIRINNIEFDSGKAGLKGKKTFILDRVAQILMKYPDYRVEIGGHTDNVGSMKKNLALSMDRAENVYKYLAVRGVSKNRLSYRGFAYKFPIADNRTAGGRRKNRRVEFILLKGGYKN